MGRGRAHVSSVPHTQPFQIIHSPLTRLPDIPDERSQFFLRKRMFPRGARDGEIRIQVEVCEEEVDFLFGFAKWRRSGRRRRGRLPPGAGFDNGRNVWLWGRGRMHAGVGNGIFFRGSRRCLRQIYISSLYIASARHIIDSPARASVP